MTNPHQQIPSASSEMPPPLFNESFESNDVSITWQPATGNQKNYSPKKLFRMFLSDTQPKLLDLSKNSETKKPNEVKIKAKIKASNVTKSTKIHNLNNNHVSLHNSHPNHESSSSQESLSDEISLQVIIRNHT
ncbi:730_t:CDS:2 [Acaulospora morrowiae]|uniref:730_t:CDS:1 n=1 Tax=Acaulospora morrowiae TaxID=94023 RepID=A0A9N9EW59_9GLOM|nr:730_t:CDS:2 [Acaulospora morrowiae]